ncbi:FtsW/RodA/SpoVE family cell cycle protein [Rickettsiales bacterium]|nr:FtsW/RodA/SpoVE family cell cycle protein [Rickettsiales bacterium]
MLSFRLLSCWWKSIDKVLLYCVFFLIGFGLLMVFSTGPSVVSAISSNSNINLFIFKQLVFVGMGISMMLFLSYVRLDYLAIICGLGFIVSILLLCAVKFFGSSIKGAARWLNIFGCTLQPSDTLKPFFIFVNGLVLTQQKERVLSGARLMASSALLCVVGLLLLIQPDFGMFMMYLMTWGIQVFVANVTLVIVASILAVFVPLLGGCWFAFDHLRYRLSNFLFNGEMFQVGKSINAIKFGGFWGLGLGEGKVKRSLPDVHSDYVFAAMYEECGAIFCVLIVLVYMLVVFRTISLLPKRNKAMMVIGYGCVGMLFLHVCINMGVAMNILPPKGTTLPMISYGGSSMLSFCTLMGIILNMTRLRSKSYRWLEG